MNAPRIKSFCRGSRGAVFSKRAPLVAEGIIIRTILKKIKQRLYHIVFSPRVLPHSSLAKRPVYIFHHIPKCAGTSMIAALRRWFFVVKDYWRYHHDEELPYFLQHPVNTGRLRTYHCLCGHFALPETHISARYPHAWRDPNYKIFTFIRDPLEVKISLYYFEKKRGYREDIDLEQHLLERDNYIASILGCTEENYQEILDRYFFIGITEHLQESMDRLAQLLDKPNVKLPLLNRSRRDSQESGLDPSIVERFKAANRLDYSIYDHCLHRFETMPDL